MRSAARRFAVYYIALMFMGKRYQERVKNSLNTPSTAAVGFASLIVATLVVYALQVASEHGYFSRMMSLPGRVFIYPIFILIYFINWRIWRKVSQPEDALGKASREVAERLPVGTILFIAIICLVLLIAF